MDATGLPEITLNAVFEFERGFISEGGDQAMRGISLAARGEMRDAPGDHFGLAGAWAGDDEER